MTSFTLCKQAIRAKRLQWLIYSALGIGFVLLYLSVFPVVQSQAHMYNALYASLPKGLLVAFNISNTAPTLMGFLSSKHFGLVWLLMIILFAISYASYSIGKEVETKTIGFLLSQPISRAKLYLARLSAGLIGLIIFIAVSELVVWPLAKLFNSTIDPLGVVLVGLAGFLFGCSVLCLSLMCSALSNTAARAGAYSGGVLTVMYSIFIASTMNTALDSAKYFSLFHYFAPGDIVSTDTLSVTSIIVFLLLSIVTSIIGIAIFRRRQFEV